MQNPICFSTGSVYKFYADFNEQITKIREFNPDGVELCFAHPTSFLDFVISDENLRYLHSLQHVSIHSPVIEITYRDDEKTREILTKIEKLYQQVRAKNVVFHSEEMENIEILKNYNFTASLENLDFRADQMQSVAEVKEELAKNSDLKLTFDFAHAYGNDPNSIPDFVKEFRDRIIEFHVAFLDKAIGDRPSYHWFLHKNDSEQVRSLLRYLDSPDIPIVIESTAAEEHEVGWLKQEIEYLREI